MVRTEGDPQAAMREVAAAVHRIDPALPLAGLTTLERAMSESLGPQKLILNLVGFFALAALLLASIGLYGVMSYAVASRQRELSIRMAIGAARADIMRLIVGRGIRLMMLGLGLGLVGSVAAARILANRLPGVSAGDPLVYASAALLLGAVAFVASWLPARRATKTDPMDALRAE
jgi:ABC-type antimicrobial peptide transport system permease subunit